jgi:general secretion pathway protein D
MKKLHRSQLAWAALALALAAGSLVAQDGDAAARKPQLLAEALKARDEGDLQSAKEKFEAILAIDSKDIGAHEGLASVNAALAEAVAAKEKADAASAAAKAPAPAAQPVGALAEVANAHQSRFEEVSRAIEVARKLTAGGDFKRAAEILDGAAAALAPVPSAAAQKLRDAVALAKQELIVRRDAGGSAAAQDEVKRLAQANSAALGKQTDAVAAAETLIRRGTAEAVDKALADLDAADRSLGAETLTNKDLKERIKQTKASALARRALLAIEARDMAKAATLVGQYAEIKGKEDPSVVRLEKELAARRKDPTYLGVDEMNPGLRAKDEKVNELLVKGRARYLYGDYQGALDAYREVLQYQPNNSESKAYQVRIRQMLSDNSGQWNRSVTKGKLLELLDETWKLPEVFNRENIKVDLGAGNDPVVEKMKQIRLPDGYIARDLPLDRALILLQTAAQTYDKEQKGVSIVPLDNANENPTVNLQLSNGITVFQALDYICKRVGYSFTVSTAGIVEVRKDAGDSLLETEFFELTQAAVVKMTGQGLTTSAPAGATGNPFAGAGTGAADPNSGNPQENAIKSFLTRSGVPFEPPATLSFDGTRLIVSQSRKNLDRVKNIIRRYSDIKQVHIEAKFLEVEQKLLNELGVNWSMTPTVTGNGGVTAGTNLRSVNTVFAQNNRAPKSLTINSQVTNATTGVTTNNLQEFPNIAPTFPGGMNLGQAANSYSGVVNILSRETLALTIRAIEESAGSDLMSSPSLTVLDGKTAVISVAQLLRYPQAYGDIQSNVGNGGGGTGGVLGAAQTSVAVTAGTPQDFTTQQVGVSLEVTPTVAADDSIALNLKPKVTEFEGFVEYGGTSVALSGGVTVTVPSGFFQPIFSVREVTTDVTVFDGATVVIGGLTREEVKTVEDKVPVLGSIPLIGAAFRSSGKSIQKRSLMVFVTANLVSPGGATLRSTHPGMRAGSTFSNPTLVSPAGAVYREPIEAAAPVEAAPVVTEPAK